MGWDQGDKGVGGVGVSLTATAWPGSRGVAAEASDFQGVEAARPLVLARNGHPKKQETEDSGKQSNT